jgi:hypothetical protein
MDFQSIDEVKDLVRKFEGRSLPLSEWHHKAHLAVACWYVLRTSRRAESCMRRSILRYNQKHGFDGFHLTLTYFWIAKVRSLIEVCQGTELAKINATVHALSDKELPLFYYSRSLLLSDRARYVWCEPDRRPLPKDSSSAIGGSWHRRFARSFV